MSKNIDKESLEKNSISRRNFIKKFGTICLGVTLCISGFDKVSQKIREILDIKYSSCLAKTIEQLKRLFPELDQWSNSKEWANDILTAFEKNNLEITDENLGIALTLIRSSSGFRSDPRSIDFIPTPSEQFFHKIKIKSPKTSGPMETSVQFAIDKKGVDYEEAIILLTERLEGLKLGIAFLKKIIEEYTNVQDPNKRLMCIFSDYNAGIGASKRAGIQGCVEKSSNQNINKDGILGNETINAVERIFKEKKVPISWEEIKLDFEIDNFHLTKTHQALCSIAKVNNIQPEIATTKVQGFIGFLKESLTGVRTSKDYAEKRFKEYKKILSIIKKNL